MRITRILHREVLKHIDYYSRFNPSPLSIEKFLTFGMFCCCGCSTCPTANIKLFTPGKEANEATSFIFLRKELPVRLANIMSELHLLPNKLLRMPSVELVQSWYERSFQEILTFEKGDADSPKALENFCVTLVKIRNRHSSVVETMAQGIIELKQTHNLDQQTEHCIQYFLNRFYMSRISIRMLINQHAALFGSDLAANNPRHIGVIDPNVCTFLSV